MLIPENIQIFQRSQKSIGYTHIWYDAGEKYQRQLEANLLFRADRNPRSPEPTGKLANHTCHNQPYYLKCDRPNLWMR